MSSRAATSPSGLSPTTSRSAGAPTSIGARTNACRHLLGRQARRAQPARARPRALPTGSARCRGRCRRRPRRRRDGTERGCRGRIRSSGVSRPKPWMSSVETHPHGEPRAAAIVVVVEALVHGVCASSPTPAPRARATCPAPCACAVTGTLVLGRRVADRGQHRVARRRPGLRVERDLDRDRASSLRGPPPPRRPRSASATSRPVPAGAHDARGRIPAGRREHRPDGPDERTVERRASPRRPPAGRSARPATRGRARRSRRLADRRRGRPARRARGGRRPPASGSRRPRSARRSPAPRSDAADLDDRAALARRPARRRSPGRARATRAARGSTSRATAHHTPARRGRPAR